jgi:Aldo/keto reductase family
MLPLCAAEGIGVIPWSPQARGKLSRDWDYSSIRTETDEAFGRLFAKTEEADKKVADRVAEVATARGVSRAQIALAWLLSGYYRPDRRRHQAAPSRRRNCRDKCQALRRGDRSLGATLRPAPSGRLRVALSRNHHPGCERCHASSLLDLRSQCLYLGFEASPEAIELPCVVRSAAAKSAWKRRHSRVWDPGAARVGTSWTETTTRSWTDPDLDADRPVAQHLSCEGPAVWDRRSTRTRVPRTR